MTGSAGWLCLVHAVLCHARCGAVQGMQQASIKGWRQAPGVAPTAMELGSLRQVFLWMELMSWGGPGKEVGTSVYETALQLAACMGVLLAHLPAWIKNNGKEKMEWLNHILTQQLLIS